jgi:hypothetical protein
MSNQWGHLYWRLRTIVWIRNIVIGALCSGIYLALCSASAIAKADIQVTIKVVDEESAVVQNAKVESGFLIRLPDWTSKTISQVGYSDSKGIYATSASADESLWFTDSKEGFYDSGGSYKFKDVINGRWVPWNPELKVVLRKIIHPVPMYARTTTRSRIQLPALEKEIGFDLIEFDWVAPYGQGKHADMIFNLTKRVASFKDFDSTLTVTFSGRFAGMIAVKEDQNIGSRLKLPRYAPTSGYQQRFVYRKSWSPGKPFEQTHDEQNNYIFRVRAEELNGKLMKAMYGKIIGDIQFEPRDSTTGEIYFTYFLNPDYTRNLEYGENLFTSLKENEQP